MEFKFLQLFPTEQCKLMTIYLTFNYNIISIIISIVPRFSFPNGEPRLGNKRFIKQRGKSFISWQAKISKAKIAIHTGWDHV